MIDLKSVEKFKMNTFVVIELKCAKYFLETAIQRAKFQRFGSFFGHQPQKRE